MRTVRQNALRAIRLLRWPGRNRRGVRDCGAERPRARPLRHAVVEAMIRTSCRCSHLLIAVVISATSCQRNPLTNRLCDSSSNREEESLTVYTDGFRAHQPLEDHETYHREAVIHGDGEYADGDVHVNTFEGHGSLARRWLLPRGGVQKTSSLRISECSGSADRFSGNPVTKLSKILFEPCSDLPTTWFR